MLLEQGKGHHEVVFFYSCCGSLDQAARYIAEGFNGVLKHWRKRNSKIQISNIKQITMTKIQNSKPVLVIEYWNLGFHCNLVLGI
jgi:hypothetical protein